MATKTYVWSDIDGELEKQVDGDVGVKTDVQAIMNSLTNIMMTKPGTRRMIPTFASTLYWLLFEPIDEITARRIAESALEAIEIWEDRIEVTGFDIEPVPDEGIYRCRLSFTVVGSDQVEQIDFVLSR